MISSKISLEVLLGISQIIYLETPPGFPSGVSEIIPTVIYSRIPGFQKSLDEFKKTTKFQDIVGHFLRNLSKSFCNISARMSGKNQQLLEGFVENPFE